MTNADVGHAGPGTTLIRLPGVGRWLAALAACLVVAGATLLGAGTARAATIDGAITSITTTATSTTTWDRVDLACTWAVPDGSSPGDIVYLGGLVPDVPDADLSPHLRSRLEVEQVLTDSGIPTLALRAAMVVGSGSTSFEIMRQLSERLPVQVLPRWMDSRVEPVAVDDVVAALVGALAAPAVSRPFDLGSGERMPYAALLRLYADRAGLRRVQVRVPGLPTALVSRLAPALTRAPASTVQSLVESLHHDMVCGRQDFMVQLLPPGHALTPVAEAVDRALAVPDAAVPDSERDIIGPLSSDAAWTGSLSG